MFRAKEHLISPSKSIDYWKKARKEWLKGYGKKTRLGDLL